MNTLILLAASSLSVAPADHPAATPTTALFWLSLAALLLIVMGVLLLLTIAPAMASMGSQILMILISLTCVVCGMSGGIFSGLSVRTIRKRYPDYRNGKSLAALVIGWLCFLPLVVWGLWYLGEKG